MTVSNGALANQSTFNTGLVSRTTAQTVAGAKTFSDDIISAARIRRSVHNAIVAFAGGGQGSATQLTGDLCFIATVTTAGDSVKLPAATTGYRVLVFNTAVNSSDVFPATGESIDALAINAALPLAGGYLAEFSCNVGGHWVSKIFETAVNLAAHIADTSTHGTTGNVVGTTDTQTLTNKTLTAPIIDVVVWDDQTTPSNPAAGFYKTYVKSDGILYILDSGGTETAIGPSAPGLSSPLTTKGDVWGYSTTDARIPIGTNGFVLTADSTEALGLKWAAASGGSGGSFVWELGDSNVPAESRVSGVSLLDFAYTDEQEIWAFVRVPDSYVAAVQITLLGLAFATAATTNKVFFKTITYLVEPGSSVLTSLTNSHTSTNSEVTVSGVANTVTNVGTLQLTDGSGQINAVSVAAGDLLAIKLFRDSSAESASATEDARLLRFSGSPKFTV